MFSRNFRFVRSIVSNYVRSKIFLQCFYLGFTFTRQSSDISHLLSCNPYRCITKATVVGLRTSARRMPKKGKVTRSTQQTLDSEKHEGGAIGSAIFLTKDEQICVKILAKPGAKQSSITDISSDGVGVQIAAPARDGEANEELVRYLAELLNVRTRTISLDKGSKSRQKVVTIESAEMSVEQVRVALSREALQD